MPPVCHLSQSQWNQDCETTPQIPELCEVLGENLSIHLFSFSSFVHIFLYLFTTEFTNKFASKEGKCYNMSWFTESFPYLVIKQSMLLDSCPVFMVWCPCCLQCKTNMTDSWQTTLCPLRFFLFSLCIFCCPFAVHECSKVLLSIENLLSLFE